MTFNREEWVAEMTRIKEMDIPVLDGEEVQISEIIDSLKMVRQLERDIQTVGFNEI